MTRSDAARQLRDGIASAVSRRHHATATSTGALAFLFPGQGSQYPGMGGEWLVYLASMRSAIEAGLGQLARDTAARVSAGLLPGARFSADDRERTAAALTATDVAQPAIGLVSCGMLDVLAELGIRPDMVAGHSYGELVALHAAGAMSREALISLSRARGTAMAEAAGTAEGAMAAVPLHRDVLAAHLHGRPDVVLANHNAPDQCVVSGRRDAVARLVNDLAEQGVRATFLPVGSAFHSPVVAAAAAAFDRALDDAALVPLTKPVYANLDGRVHPADVAELRARMRRHLESPVEFVAQIEEMYAAGARVFVEVGPKAVLSGMTSRILGDRPHLTLALDRQGTRLEGLLDTLAALWVGGASIDPWPLFRDRGVRRIDWRSEPDAPVHDWFVDGGRVRHRDQPVGLAGATPFVTADTPPAPVQAHDASAAPQGHDALVAYQQYQRAMRDFVEQQERMLFQVLDRLGVSGMARTPEPAHASPRGAAETLTPPPAPPASAPAPAPVPAPMLGAPRELDLRDTLVELLVDRTGYTADAFGADVDLEAELGVDSIKRIEVLGRLLDRVHGTGRRVDRTRMDRLMRARSMREMVSEVELLQAEAETAPPPRPTQTCPVWTMAAHAEPLPPHVQWRPDGLVLITADGLGVASALASRLRASGTTPVIVSRAALADPSSLGRAMDAWRTAHGPVRGVVHLAALAPVVEPPTIEVWREEAAVQVKGLFELLARTSTDRRDRAGTFMLLAATAFGGRYGRQASGTASLAVSGGVHGVVRTLAAEDPTVSAKTVDVDPLLAPTAIANVLAAELTRAIDDAEVGYEGDTRLVFRPHRSPQPDSSADAWWRPSAGWVLLATGGARGITAHLAAGLAAPGVHVVVVGRSAVSSTAAHAGLDALRARGATVEYHAVDVRDEPAFGALLDEIRARHGRLDAVLHGAGVIEDAPIGRKDRASFDRVFDTKADSAWILRRHLQPDGLKWVALFSSVTARVGNLGQADYAAGNEVLNRMAWEMARAWPGTRVAAIGWGPWRGVGMVSADLERVLEARGYTPIDPDGGAQALGRILDASGDAEVLAGDGPWNPVETAAGVPLTSASRADQPA
ncbi:MAG: SDR family oxidoreductase [Vicinamibacterales bacterium]